MRCAIHDATRAVLPLPYRARCQGLAKDSSQSTPCRSRVIYHSHSCVVLLLLTLSPLLPHISPPFPLGPFEWLLRRASRRCSGWNHHHSPLHRLGSLGVCLLQCQGARGGGGTHACCVWTLASLPCP